MPAGAALAGRHAELDGGGPGDAGRAGQVHQAPAGVVAGGAGEQLGGCPQRGIDPLAGPVGVLLGKHRGSAGVVRRGHGGTAHRPARWRRVTLAGVRGRRPDASHGLGALVADRVYEILGLLAGRCVGRHGGEDRGVTGGVEAGCADRDNTRRGSDLLLDRRHRALRVVDDGQRAVEAWSKALGEVVVGTALGAGGGLGLVARHSQLEAEHGQSEHDQGAPRPMGSLPLQALTVGNSS